MNPVLAAEGGYQEFALHGGEWFVLIGSALTAVLAVVVGAMLTRGVPVNFIEKPDVMFVAY